MKMLQRLVGFDPRTMTVKTEFVAALTTFLSMSYILAINPMILGTTGMDKATLFSATAIASAIATLLIAFMAKLPFAQAPGAGLNAFFAFTMCQIMGLTWQQSLAILLIEGLIFILITFLNIREKILEAIPANLRYAITAGIGTFIAFIGLRNAGLVVSNQSTLVHLGDFTPSAMLGVIGILVTGTLIFKKVKGALFWSIIIVTIIGIPMGETHLTAGWSPVSMPNSLEPTFLQFDFSGLLSFKTVIVVFSLLLVNIFDTLGTLMALADKTGVVQPDGSIPRIKEAMLSDAIGTTCGACLGTSTVTTYLESASGVAEGGRSGLTAAFVGIFFLLSLFLSPIFLLIPSAATTGALVMVGAMMLESVRKIDFSDPSEALPSFIVVIAMPLCYSISDGICMGLLAYVFIKLLTGNFKKLNLTLAILAIFLLMYYIAG
ncbi:MAG: NCS2 family permease [Bacteroidales bacterium]|nr:NCS2 family permease [Bacteroidales bacterium]